jgi:two-component system, OmpR family, sensor histidine kinase TctE
MLRSLRFRFFFALLIPLIVLKTSDAIYNHYTDRVDSRLETTRLLLHVARYISLVIDETPTGSKVPNDLTDKLKSLVGGEKMYYSVVGESNGMLLGSAWLPTLPVKAVDPVAAEVKIDNRLIFAITYRVNSSVGPVVINVGVDQAESSEWANSKVWRDLIWQLLVLALTFLLVMAGITFGLSPLHALHREIDARSFDDLTHIDDSDRPSELETIVKSLNRLFDVIRSAIDMQQRFVANAAHHLRTPIAGLTAQIELLKRETQQEQHKQRLSRMLAALGQFSRLTNQLLSISRVESGISSISNRCLLDLKDIVVETTSRMLDRAIERNISFAVNTESALVTADPSLIEELLENILDNALKYTPEHGQINIAAGIKSERAFLTVDDSGPGIPADERKRVLERFYRSSGALMPGSGLGLAISKEIASLYKGTIEIGNRPDGTGTKVTVHFPLSQK